MADNLQEKTFYGMSWTLGKQISLQGWAFIQGIILARLLLPSYYGIIALTSIFFGVSGIFIDSGFTTALMRKKKQDAIDYSTVYVTNVCLTFFFATIICFISPYVAEFYNEPDLKGILIANSILMILNSFIAVQATRLQINLQFKAISFINIVTSVVVGIVTIILAFKGFGVWSLVYPKFLTPFICAIFYWRYQHWFPGIKFSFKVWREFFSFGSKLLATSLINEIWTNITPIIIGKKFSSADLGYYSRAAGYAKLPIVSFRNSLGSVTFPVLSKIQDDDVRLGNVYRKFIRISGFLIFPIMIGLSVLSKPLIIIMITDKWAQSIPYLQIMCFSVMWYPIHVLNLNLLQVKGRSDLFLRLEIIKKAISLIVILISMHYGIIYMCLGGIFVSIFSLYINTYYTGKMINVGLKIQLLDLMPTLFYSLTMGLLIWGMMLLVHNMFLQVIIGFVLGLAYYLTVSYLFRSPELQYSKTLINKFILKRVKRNSHF